jgi:hypothetical protein
LVETDATLIHSSIHTQSEIPSSIERLIESALSIPEVRPQLVAPYCMDGPAKDLPTVRAAQTHEMVMRPQRMREDHKPMSVVTSISDQNKRHDDVVETPVIASKEAQSEMPDDVGVITANGIEYILSQLEENAFNRTLSLITAYVPMATSKRLDWLRVNGCA